MLDVEDEPRVKGADTDQNTTENIIADPVTQGGKHDGSDGEGSGREDGEESGDHTVSTIVESDRVKFDNGIQDDSMELPEPMSAA